MHPRSRYPRRGLIIVSVLAAGLLPLSGCATPTAQDYATDEAARLALVAQENLLALATVSKSDPLPTSEAIRAIFQTDVTSMTGPELRAMNTSSRSLLLYSIDSTANQQVANVFVMGRGQGGGGWFYESVHSYTCVSFTYERSRPGKLTASEATCPELLVENLTFPLDDKLASFDDLDIEEIVEK